MLEYVSLSIPDLPITGKISCHHNKYIKNRCYTILYFYIVYVYYKASTKDDYSEIKFNDKKKTGRWQITRGLFGEFISFNSSFVC